VFACIEALQPSVEFLQPTVVFIAKRADD